MQDNTAVKMTPEEQKAFEGYLKETKQRLKTFSKNDLVRMVAALLIDKHALMGMLKVQQEDSAKLGSVVATEGDANVSLVE